MIKREVEFETALKKFAKNANYPGDRDTLGNDAKHSLDPPPTAPTKKKAADIVAERTRNLEREIMKDPLQMEASGLGASAMAGKVNQISFDQ